MRKRALPALTWLLFLIAIPLQRVQAQPDSRAQGGAGSRLNYTTEAQTYRLPDGSDTSIGALERAVRSETEGLVHTAAALARAGAGFKRDAVDAALRDAALRRKTAMIALMEAAPEVALRNALPPDKRDALPAAIRNHIESAATRTGTLEVLGFLREDGGRGIENYLVVDDQRLRLLVDEISDEYMTGTVMTVRGILLSDRLAAIQETVIVHKAVTFQDIKSDEIAVRNALVININFSDLQAEPWTLDFVNNLFFNTIAPWYEEGSYWQTTTVANAIGWFTIDASSTSCAPSTFQSQAVAAARAAGYEPNDYHHVIIAFPRVAACGWAGLGQLPGRISWLNNAMTHRVAVHELGHNLGLSHSRSRRCSDAPLLGTCTSSEYGDRFDNMGSGGQAHYHAAYRARLGWIPSSDVLTVTPETGKIVAALRSAASSYGPRVLRVQRSGRNEYLHVEVREAVGFDSVLAQFPALLNGVAVYLGGTNLGNQWIVDIGYATATVEDAPLQFGETLYDFDGDVSITPLYAKGGETYVYVYYGLGISP